MNERDIEAMLAGMQGGKQRRPPAQPEQKTFSGVHGPMTPQSLPRAQHLDESGVRVNVDLRGGTRFSQSPNDVGISGNMLVNRKPGIFSRWAQDPFEKFLAESHGALDQTGLQKALFDVPVARPNFSPLHEILHKRSWDDSEKAVALRHVLEYGLESVPDDRTRGLDRLHGNPPQTAMQAALEGRNLAAVNILAEAGASTTMLDSQGFTSMAHAVLSGMPEAIPVLMSKNPAPWTSRKGDTLMDLSFKRLETQASIQTPEGMVTEIETFYKSLASIKQYRLEAIGPDVDRTSDPDGEHAFNDKLDIISERFDAILKERQMQPFGGYFKTMIQQIKDTPALEGARLSELVGPKTHRAFTNPNQGISDVHTMEYYKHPWALVRGLYAGIDAMSSKLDRANAMVQSQSTVYFRMQAMPPGKGTPEYTAKYGANGDAKYAEDMTAYKEKMASINETMRPTVNLDLVLTNFKDLANPQGDTLLTKAIRTGNYELADTFMDMNVNMHARDAQGQTAMHLLAASCDNKTDFTNMITGLVGKPDGAGGRTSMFNHGNTADWDIKNNEGQTFLDILQEKHPEWVADIEHHLGVKNVTHEIPEWSMTRVLALGGPEKVLALALSSVPTLDALPDTALPSERRDHTDKALNILNNVVHQLENTEDPGKVSKLTGQLSGMLEKCDATTKMGLVMGLMKEGYDLDSPHREKVLLQTAAGLARDISSANPDELEKMFNLSNQITDATETVWKSQELATHLIVQAGISMGNTDLQELGQVMEKRLREVAVQKYSVDMDNEHTAGNNASGNGPSKG